MNFNNQKEVILTPKLEAAQQSYYFPSLPLSRNKRQKQVKANSTLFITVISKSADTPKVTFMKYRPCQAGSNQ